MPTNVEDCLQEIGRGWWELEVIETGKPWAKWHPSLMVDFDTTNLWS